jgi:hypothetical protein
MCRQFAMGVWCVVCISCIPMSAMSFVSVYTSHDASLVF